ncbi:hypothetical protein [Botrimarina sp.]|uniref:hypothetical protein n=1 Tax=Botrimarina sp. TaxID=2795802 RepID=UPI0032ECC0B2
MNPLTRLKHAAVTLVATLVAYQLYLLVVVPLVEPTLPVRPFDPATEAEWQGGKAAVGRYQRMLAHYLPEGHWALAGSPQVYEYGPVVFVLEDFKPLADSRVELTKSLLVAFPTPREPGQPPPRDAIVVEPPPRAVIKFDKFDPSLAFSGGDIGRPVEGYFPGPLVVRSDMAEEGPADDLRLVTRDLRFNPTMVWTTAEVSVRIGSHSLAGRHLECRFVREAHAGASDLPVAGVDTLELREDVRLLIDSAELGLDPAPQPLPRRSVARGSVYEPRGGVRLAAAQAPAGGRYAEVTCDGPLTFDFTRFVASLTENVVATLPQPEAGSDQLTCAALRLYLGDGSGAPAEINPRDEPDLARRQSRTLAGLRPERVEALGKPVRIDSPSRQAALRGERVVAWLGRRKVRVEGAPASLAQGLSEARAALLEYEAPEPGSGRAIGDLTAGGPGWLRVVPSADDPERVYQARWHAAPGRSPSVTVRRDARGEPLLKMVGRPEIAAAGLGRVQADQITARLAEVPADGDDGPALEIGGDQAALLLRRIDAIGAVDFSGEQLTGHADSLTTLVRHTPLEGAGDGPGLVASDGGAAPNDPTRDGARYELRTRSIQIDLGMAGQRVAPIGVVCDGGVRLEQQPTDPSATPLRIVGQQLRVDRLDRRGAARLTLAGPSSDQQDALAEIQSDGLRVWVRDVHIDQAAGRAWTEGEGRALVRLPSDDPQRRLGGEATLRWRGGMDFDGRRLAVKDDVFAESADGWLRCRTMSAVLASPIDLANPGGSGPEGPAAVEIGRVDCQGGVTIDYRTADEAGQRSHERARLESLSYDRQTGAIAGEGPGTIRSVRLAEGGLPTPGAGAGASLGFLRVDFRDALEGNAEDRRARFVGAVQAVYGPVLAWEQQLPLRSPDGVPPDAVELTCSELRVLESPAASLARGANGGAPLGPVELRALGGVRIDAAPGAEGGKLIAEAAMATYSQAADRFVLEGDANQLARLWFRADATQPFTPAAAHKLTHYVKAERTIIDDLRGVRYQADGARATGAAPSPR